MQNLLTKHNEITKEEFFERVNKIDADFKEFHEDWFKLKPVPVKSIRVKGPWEHKDDTPMPTQKEEPPEKENNKPEIQTEINFNKI